MPEFMVTTPGGQKFKVTAPEGATEEQALAYAKEHAPKQDTPKRGYPGSSLGLPEIKSPLDVMLKPEGALETVASIPLNAAVLGGAGTLAKAAGVPALVGKMAAGAGIGAGQAAEEGKPMGMAALLDAALVGAGEGVAGVAGKYLGKAARGFEGGEQKIRDAFAAIADRLPRGAKFNVPSLSNARLTVQEMAEKLLSARGADFKQALKEIRSVFNATDKQMLAGGPRPGAGQVFVDRAPKYRRDPSSLSVLAEKVAPVAGTALSAQAITPVQGVPLGAMEAAGVADLTGSGLGSLARHILPHFIP